MDETVKHRLAQLAEMASSGLLGSAVKASSRKYHEIGAGTPSLLALVEDFYRVQKTEEDNMMLGLADVFCQLIIVIYREANKQDVAVAEAFVNSFIKDFPGASGSCTYPQWEALARASLAFKSASRDPVLAWQQTTRLVQAYNEFLNALLGFFIVAWRCALGKAYSVNIFQNAYGSKLNTFSQLTGGDDGAFYMIFRLAKPSVRNAVAHEDIWLDQASNTVRYTDGRSRKHEYEMPLVEFVGLAALGSRLAQAYLVALSTILILEAGSPADKVLFPNHLVKIYYHSSK